MIRVSSGERGVILIALLWILVALSAIALSFSRESFVEVAAARNSRDSACAYYVARAGMATAIYQLVQKQLMPRVQRLDIQGPPNPLDLGKCTGDFGDGSYDVEIQDESGKINLNFASEEQLRALTEVIGINKREGDIIVDSILDWKDVDNLHRLNGAEDDYYQTLTPPYHAKNGRMDTVEELLLVRGVTRDYYYGHMEKPPDSPAVFRYGLSRYVTVYSISNRINVNYAPPEVLLTVPGMTPEAAQKIYDRRSIKPFATVEEITRTLPVTLGANTLPFLTTDETGVYTLTASAHRENSKVKRVIRAVVSLSRDPRSQDSYRIIYWNENVPIL